MPDPQLTDEDNETGFDDNGEPITVEFLSVEIRCMCKQEMKQRLEEAGLTTHEIEIFFAYTHTIDPIEN